jgi:hypothetical protein
LPRYVLTCPWAHLKIDNVESSATTNGHSQFRDYDDPLGGVNDDPGPPHCDLCAGMESSGKAGGLTRHTSPEHDDAGRICRIRMWEVVNSSWRRTVFVSCAVFSIGLYTASTPEPNGSAARPSELSDQIGLLAARNTLEGYVSDHVESSNIVVKILVAGFATPAVDCWRLVSCQRSRDLWSRIVVLAIHRLRR